MPTIDMSKKDLEGLVGKKFSQKELEDALLYVKGEIDAQDGDNLKVDVKETNRPDVWSTEGISRELRARMGMEKGIPEYKVAKGKLKVRIEKSVKGVRPLTVGAVVKGIRITEPLLIQMIQLQEKIHTTYGRKRKEAAMGVYDFDKVRGDIRYYGAKPREKKFIPLEYRAEMGLDEILESHPKGREFGHLLKGKDVYPIFEDSEGNVLSMPPIINSNYSGKVTQSAKNLFIEVSGFNMHTISTALNVMVMALADRGGKIESATIIDADGKKFTTPAFGTKRMQVDISYLKKISGLNLSEREITALLQKARFEVKRKGKKLALEYGDYRTDILHPVDIIEDLLIGFDYNKILPQRPKMSVVGEEREETAYLDKVRDACVGLGLQEVLTFNLTSKEKQGTLAGLGGQQFVEIANPVSANWEILRKSIYPELLEFLSKNKHVEYPQKIFEVGKALEIDDASATRTRERDKLCIALAGNGYGFTLIKSAFEAICRELGKKCELTAEQHPALKEGRGAIISGGSPGFLGELSDRVKKNFGLEQDIVVLEMEL